MKKASFFSILYIFLVVGILMAVTSFDQAKASAKPAGHGEPKKEEPKPEATVEEDTFDNSSDVKHEVDKKEEAPAEESAAEGHGEEKKEDHAEAAKEEHGKAAKKGGHGEEEAAPVVAKEEASAEQFQFYESVQSLAELMEEPQAETEKVKVVYRVPPTCSDFAIYLESKQKNLERLENELEHKRQLLLKLKGEFDQSVQKYTELEKRIQNMMRTGDGKFENNPELVKMVKLYESISPEEAADRLKNLDLDLTLALLKGMAPKKLSQIMVALDPQISAALSSRMVRGF